MSVSASSSAVEIISGGALGGRVRVPGDKSISHRALVFGALAEGDSTVTGLSDGDDVQRTKAALAALGVDFDGHIIRGGRSRLIEAERPLYVGNSGTSIRLLSGVVASLPFLTVLVGDSSIHRRPMDRIALPLRAMGATIDGREHGRYAPLAIRGGDLHGIDFTPPVPSAQVKGSILLAGLSAAGKTTVRETVATRRHTEEFLELTGGVLEEHVDDGISTVTTASSVLSPFSLDVPGDPSQAAFFVVAATLVPDSELTLENIYVGPGRAGFLDVLDRMGASIERRPRSSTTADLIVRSASLSATDIGGEEIPDCIDELPILAIAAALASGTTMIRDAGELRVKESDRIATMVAGLRTLNVTTEELPDGFSVIGAPQLGGGAIDSEGDHRIAMAFSIAGLVANGPVEISGFDAVETSWPGFLGDLEGLTCQ